MGTIGRTGEATRSRVRVATFALEGALWAVLVIAFVTLIVRPIVSDAVLGIGEGPYWGAPSTTTARVSSAAWEEFAAANGGTMPALGPGSLVGGPFGRGELVEATLPNHADISVWAPMDFRQMVAFVGAPILAGAVLVVALLIAILVVRDLRHGRLFSTRNLRRTYVLAAVVAIGGTISEVAGAWGRVGVLENPRLNGYVLVDWSVSWMPLVVGLGIACAAEVVRLGIRMQSDVEGLV